VLASGQQPRRAGASCGYSKASSGGSTVVPITAPLVPGRDQDRGSREPRADTCGSGLRRAVTSNKQVLVGPRPSLREALRPKTMATEQPAHDFKSRPASRFPASARRVLRANPRQGRGAPRRSGPISRQSWAVRCLPRSAPRAARGGRADSCAQPDGAAPFLVGPRPRPRRQPGRLPVRAAVGCGTWSSAHTGFGQAG